MSKSILRLVSASIILLSAVFAGCAPAPRSTGPALKDPVTVEGGMLKFGRHADLTKLDPQLITDIPSSQYLFGTVYEGLIGKDKDMNLRPLLAVSWKSLHDTVWEFTLRPNVVFHDGSPFNAQAVKLSFDRLLAPQTHSPHAAYYNFIKEVKIINDHTVHFVLKFPFAAFPHALASFKAVIISPLDGTSSEIRHPAGTGPFTFASWEPGLEFRILKNPHYWGTLPKIDGVIFKIVTDAALRIALVEQGDLHLAQPLTVNSIQQVQTADNLKIYRTDSVSVQYLGFNTTSPPFDDVRIRQAISYAIEKESIIKGLYKNAGKRAVSPVPPHTFAHTSEVKHYEYNLNMAKELMIAAGYRNGFKTTLWCRNTQIEQDLAQVIQSQLKGIGIDITIISLANSAYRNAIQLGQHDLFLEQTVDETGDADYNQFRKFSSTSFGAAGNRFFYHNANLDALIEAGRREHDPLKRLELYAKAQKLEMDEALCVPICIPEILVITRKNILGFEMDAAFNPIFTNVIIK